MKPLQPGKDKDVVIVSFDIESMFEMRQLENGTEVEEHVPVLLCAMVVCSACYKPGNVRLVNEQGSFANLKENDCSLCLGFKHVFRGKDCVSRFTNYLYKVLSPHVARVNDSAVIRVFAHNFGRYDGRFILKDFFASDISDTKVVMQGNKILCFDVGNVRYQDSLNIFLCALRALPATYQFSQRVKKGEFPYLFNTAANQEYVGRTPPLESYGIEHKKPKEKQELMLYYETVKDRTDFNLQAEMLTYCMADVEVLLIAVQEFRQTFVATVGFDPIQSHFTLPSMSFAAFRRSFLGPKVIGLTPNRDYGVSVKSNSHIGKTWLDWLEHQTPGLEITREQQLGIRVADGFDHENKTIYEFNGCYFHGCPRCYRENRDVVGPGVMKKTPNQAYAEWLEKLQYYEQLKTLIPHLKLHVIWSCEFLLQVRQSRHMKTYVDSRMTYYRKLEKVGGCELRKGYYGGRTNNALFYVNCTANQWIEIVDFCSLYPSVLAKREYMVGHPVVIRENFHHYIASDRIKTDVFGFVKCLILPPKQMRFPILPSRVNGRLEFVLCAACAARNDNDFCRHNDEQRCLIGTFTTPELTRALDHGYRIQEVYEILHWPLRSSLLFKEYIERWVKLKQEASGFPHGIETEEQKDDFIKKYFEDTGIKLDKENTRPDPNLRNIAKIMMNSFYGKFAQRPNLETTEIVDTYKRIWELATDADKIITGLISVGYNKLFVSWKLSNEEDAKQGNVNVAIAAFVTSYARLELWQQLDIVERRCGGTVCYFDTDSVIYIAYTGMTLLKTGSQLGELTREIKQDEEVKQAVFLGPKNYAYTIRNKVTGEERTIVKVKGITLTANVLEQLPIALLLEMAHEYCHNRNTIEKYITQHRIKSYRNQDVINQKLLKVYRAVSEKRIMRGNFTFPKGYVE